MQTNRHIFQGLSPSEMAHAMSVGDVFPWIRLLAFYYGWLLNSFLLEAKNPTFDGHLKDASETWDVTILLHPTFFPEIMLYFSKIYNSNSLTTLAHLCSHNLFTIYISH